MESEKASRRIEFFAGTPEIFWTQVQKLEVGNQGGAWWDVLCPLLSLIRTLVIGCRSCSVNPG